MSISEGMRLASSSGTLNGGNEGPYVNRNNLDRRKENKQEEREREREGEREKVGSFSQISTMIFVSAETQLCGITQFKTMRSN